MGNDPVWFARWFGPDDELPPVPDKHISISTVLIAAHLPKA